MDIIFALVYEDDKDFVRETLSTALSIVAKKRGISGHDLRVCALRFHEYNVSTRLGPTPLQINHQILANNVELFKPW